MDLVSSALPDARKFTLALAESLGIRRRDLVVEARDSSDRLLVLKDKR